MNMLLLLSSGVASLHSAVTRHASGWLELTLPPQRAAFAGSSCQVNAAGDADGLLRQFLAAMDGSDAKGVLLTGSAGNSLCTGGDVHELAEAAKDSVFGPARARAFLTLEYAVASRLRELQPQIPVVSIADGALMGAGAMMFMSAEHRVASSSTVFSLPSCTLGLCPDCGALDLLTSGAVVPQALGLVLMLSGGRLSAEQSFLGATSGLSTQSVESASELEALRERLLAAPPRCCAEVLSRSAALATAEGPGRLPSSATAACILACVESVVQDTHALRNDAAGRIDALQAGLAAKARTADDAAAAAWLRDAVDALGRGCPAAQVVTYVAGRRASLERQQLRRCHEPAEPDSEERREETALSQSALGLELAANSILATRADFLEGASCACGLRCGDQPLWSHASRQEAASDPEVTRLVAAMLEASPFVLDDPGVRFAAARALR